MLELIKYVCESCGYVIYVEKEERPVKCPFCRGRLIEAEKTKVEEEKLVKISCKECEKSFYYEKGEMEPFKCAFCDYSFSGMSYF